MKFFNKLATMSYLFFFFFFVSFTSVIANRAIGLFSISFATIPTVCFSCLFMGLPMVCHIDLCSCEIISSGKLITLRRSKLSEV